MGIDYGIRKDFVVCLLCLFWHLGASKGIYVSPRVSWYPQWCPVTRKKDRNRAPLGTPGDTRHMDTFGCPWMSKKGEKGTGGKL